jgi:hypothetical protein
MYKVYSVHKTTLKIIIYRYCEPYAFGESMYRGKVLPFMAISQYFIQINSKKKIVFWNVTPCGSYKDRYFGGR